LNRQAFHNTFITVNRRYEKKYQPKVEDVLIPDGLVPTIKQHGIRAGEVYLSHVLNNPKLQLIIRQLYVDVGLKHAQMNYTRMRDEVRKNGSIKSNVFKGYGYNNEFLLEKELIIDMQVKASFGFNPTWTKFIVDYLNRFLIEKITFEVSRTTRDELLKVLNQAITEGWSIDETVKRIESLPFTKMQAARIVRTEVNRAANVGAKAQSSTFAFEQNKEWISAEDNRVRGLRPSDHANHVLLDGVTINEGDVFVDIRNGDRLEFPGDPRASAASTINCRCSVAYVAKRNAEGRLIPKRQTTTVIFPNQRVNRQIVTI
jgi:hypothetical protein